MSDSEPIPHSKAIWPPAPLHSTEPTHLFVSTEGVEVTQTGNRLVVLNKSTRLLILFEGCVFLFCLSIPWLHFWISRFHNHNLSGLVPYIIRSYHFNYGINSLVLLMTAGLGCMFYFYLSLGVVTVDGKSGTVKANGRLRPMSKLEAVRIKHGQSDAIGRRFVVSFVWNGEGPIPWWRTPLVKSAANTSFLGAFRTEANAEKIADAIAEFAGVPGQHRTTTKNSV